MSLSFNGNAEFKPRFSRWLQIGKVAKICDLWFALGVKASWSKISNGKEKYRVCYLGRIWRRLEQLERIYSRFPSVDQSGRFAGVPNLRKSLYRQKTRVFCSKGQQIWSKITFILTTQGNIHGSISGYYSFTSIFPFIPFTVSKEHDRTVFFGGDAVDRTIVRGW